MATITVLKAPEFITSETIEVKDIEIVVHKSIFTNRVGKNDIVIKKFYPQHKDNWGEKVPGGFMRVIGIIAQESGEVLREYEVLPDYSKYL